MQHIPIIHVHFLCFIPFKTLYVQKIPVELSEIPFLGLKYTHIFVE